MIHVLYKGGDTNNCISVKPNENLSTIEIQDSLSHNEFYSTRIELTPKELSDFIGILLHVQAKIKRNGRK